MFEKYQIYRKDYDFMSTTRRKLEELKHSKVVISNFLTHVQHNTLKKKKHKCKYIYY